MSEHSLNKMTKNDTSELDKVPSHTLQIVVVDAARNLASSLLVSCQYQYMSQLYVIEATISYVHSRDKRVHQNIDACVHRQLIRLL